MNTTYNVLGYTLQIDNGTLEIMAEQSNGDWANPCDGLNVMDQTALVLFGGLARKAESEGKPRPKTFEECKEGLRSFAPQHCLAILKVYTEAITRPVDDLPAEVTTEKKS